MKKTRFIAFILAMLMAGSTLVACSTGEDPAETKAPGTNDANTETEEETLG